MEDDVCEYCMLRLYNSSRGRSYYGVLHYGNLAIIPHNDKKLMREMLSIASSTGDGHSNFAIAPMIQCSKLPNDNEMVSNNIYNDCFHATLIKHSLWEAKNILLCGLQAIRCFYSADNVEPFAGFHLKTGSKHIVCTYSPRVKYVDESKFEKFKEHLKTWYNCSITNDWSVYDFVER